MAVGQHRLLFVGSDRLLCERTSVGGWEFRSATGRCLGRLAGIVTDVTSCTIRYFVVERPDSVPLARFLVSFCPVQVDRKARALCAQVREAESADLEAW
jgi:hypothetical protein